MINKRRWELEFLNHNHLPDCDKQVDKVFPDYYCLNYAAKGGIHFQMDSGERQILEAPLVWFCQIGPRMRYGALPGRSWDQWFITFRGEAVKDLIACGFLPNRKQIPYAHLKNVDLTPHWQQLFEDLDSLDFLPAEKVNRFEALLLSLHKNKRGREEQPSTDHRDGMEQVKIMMETRAKESFDLEGEAAKLNMSYSNFRKRFKEKYRYSPGDFLLANRMKIAVYLLKSTTKRIAEVATLSGFSDAHYFSRYFRRKFGVTPRKYRERQTEL